MKKKPQLRISISSDGKNPTTLPSEVLKRSAKFAIFAIEEIN